MKHSIALALLVSVIATGCSLEAEVESDTSWSGSFDGRTVDGSGNDVVKLGSSSNVRCAVVQKKTTSGYLTVEISGDKKTTTAAFGVVSVCGGGSY